MITRYRSALSSLMLVAVISLVSARVSKSEMSDQDADLAALEERGGVGVGVDQYASTHRFDALADGGRVEFVHDGQDEEAVETTRAHLKEIQTGFGASVALAAPFLVGAGSPPWPRSRSP